MTYVKAQNRSKEIIMTDAQKKEAAAKVEAAKAAFSALQAALKTPSNPTAAFDKLFLTATTLEAAVTAHKKAYPKVKSLITVGQARSHVKFRMTQNGFVYSAGLKDLKTADQKFQIIGRQ